MSDVSTGPGTGPRGTPPGTWQGGSPPPVLLGALAAALIIAVTLIALASSGGGDDGGTPAAAPAASDRVVLSVSFDGPGTGTVRLSPGDIRCRRDCDHTFDAGTRVTATADPGSASTFEGWDHLCDGDGTCSFALTEDRTLGATFEDKAADECADDPACEEEQPSGKTTPSADCDDRRDNDGDGLVDTAQDPDCAESGTESGVTAPPPPPPPPSARPPASPGECSDGEDNDGDGLTDTAQDPDCVTGESESGRSTGGTPALSECSDGRDNDGDGLIDKAQDPGCAADRSEAG